METGKMINRISNRLRRRSREIQETIGISGAQGNILDYILLEAERHPVYQKEIENEFGLRPSTATGALKSLERRGLIQRIQEEKDARWKRIVFTERAKDLEDALRREIKESERILLEGITETEKAEFLRISGKMLKNLDTAAPVVRPENPDAEKLAAKQASAGALTATPENTTPDNLAAKQTSAEALTAKPENT